MSKLALHGRECHMGQRKIGLVLEALSGVLLSPGCHLRILNQLRRSGVTNLNSVDINKPSRSRPLSEETLQETFVDTKRQSDSLLKTTCWNIGPVDEKIVLPFFLFYFILFCVWFQSWPWRNSGVVGFPSTFLGIRCVNQTENMDFEQASSLEVALPLLRVITELHHGAENPDWRKSRTGPDQEGRGRKLQGACFIIRNSF